MGDVFVNGETYQFYVTANNATGESQPSQTIACKMTNRTPASVGQFVTSIHLNGSLTTSPYAFVMNNTTYMPLYYVHSILAKLGINQYLFEWAIG